MHPALTTYMDSPCVIVAHLGKHVYYTELDHVPSADEYTAFGSRIAQKMVSDIGQMPQRWKIIEEFDPDEVAAVMGRKPVKV